MKKLLFVLTVLFVPSLMLAQQTSYETYLIGKYAPKLSDGNYTDTLTIKFHGASAELNVTYTIMNERVNPNTIAVSVIDDQDNIVKDIKIDGTTIKVTVEYTHDKTVYLPAYEKAIPQSYQETVTDKTTKIIRISLEKGAHFSWL